MSFVWSRSGDRPLTSSDSQARVRPQPGPGPEETARRRYTPNRRGLREGLWFRSGRLSEGRGSSRNRQETPSLTPPEDGSPTYPFQNFPLILKRSRSFPPWTVSLVVSLPTPLLHERPRAHGRTTPPYSSIEVWGVGDDVEVLGGVSVGSNFSH